MKVYSLCASLTLFSVFGCSGGDAASSAALAIPASLRVSSSDLFARIIALPQPKALPADISFGQLYHYLSETTSDAAFALDGAPFASIRTQIASKSDLFSQLDRTYGHLASAASHAEVPPLTLSRLQQAIAAAQRFLPQGDATAIGGGTTQQVVANIYALLALANAEHAAKELTPSPKLRQNAAFDLLDLPGAPTPPEGWDLEVAQLLDPNSWWHNYVKGEASQGNG